jgi:hypothetical protein
MTTEEIKEGCGKQLKYVLDYYKDNPKMLKILSPIASMSEKDQEASLKIIEMVLKVKMESK